MLSQDQRKLPVFHSHVKCIIDVASDVVKSVLDIGNRPNRFLESKLFDSK